MNETSMAMVATGGALGAYCRYALGRWIDGRLGPCFPYGTLMVNALGCFLMGLTAAAMSRGVLAAAPWRDLIAEGFLGALTTFSTFSMDTFKALSSGDIPKGLLNLVISLALCLAGVALGCRLMV